MDSIDDIILDADERMGKCGEYLHGELSGLRTGKASPSLVENVTVDYYGTQTQLRELAGISTPEPRLIVINAYDPSSLQGIEKAILAANLGVTPMNDGKIIRIPIPELSEERRQEMTKIAKTIAEEQRVAVRNVRRDANDSVKALQKDSKITEDERSDTLEEIQKSTDEYIKKIDAMLAAKEQELMEV